MPGFRWSTVLLFLCSSFVVGCAGSAAPGSAGGIPPDDGPPSDQELEVAAMQEATEDLIVDFDDAMSAEQRDCETICQLRDNICDLSRNICDIALSNPGYATTLNQCMDAGESCDDTDLITMRECGCEYLPEEERTRRI